MDHDHQQNSQPEPQDNILARVAKFMAPEYRDGYWELVVKWASRLRPTDTLLRIVEALAYMVMSMHGVPQRLAEERAKFLKIFDEADKRRNELMGDVNKLTERCQMLLHDGTKAMLKERQEYRQAFDSGMKTLNDKIDKKLATLPQEVASALVAMAVQEVHHRVQSLQSYRSLMYAGLGTVIFVAGCWFGHLFR